MLAEFRGLRNFPTDRNVFADFAVDGEDGGDSGVHPIRVAVLLAVFQYSAPDLFRPYRFPKIFEHRTVHVGMSDDAVRTSDEFVAVVAGNFAELVVGERDGSYEIRNRNDRRRVDRFPVFFAEVFRGDRMGVEKRDEAFFENPVEDVGFRLAFEHLFRRPPQIVETFGKRSGSYAFEFLSGAGSDFRNDG